MKFADKTYVVGIGAQKSGTTWLHSYLAHRGDVFMPRKELHYFDQKYWNRLRRSTWSEADLADGAHYVEYFRSRVPPRMALFGEITPAYALIGEAGFSEMRSLFNRARIIFVLRDPTERFYSQLRMDRKRLWQNGEPNPRTLLDRRAYFARSQYDETIPNLERVFEPTDILYLFYEHLFSGTAIERLCSFLGVPFMQAEFKEVINRGEKHQEISESFDSEVRARFAPTYRFCRAKFGNALPLEWGCDERSTHLVGGSISQGAIQRSADGQITQ